LEPSWSHSAVLTFYTALSAPSIPGIGRRRSHGSSRAYCWRAGEIWRANPRRSDPSKGWGSSAAWAMRTMPGCA